MIRTDESGQPVTELHVLTGTDVDFKIVPLPAAPVSCNALHRALGVLRGQVTAALEAAGFVFDPTAPANWRSRNDNRYTIWHLPYEADGESAGVLRPTIQIELTYAPLRSFFMTVDIRRGVVREVGGGGKKRENRYFVGRVAGDGR